jgi:hypothetical protein
MAGASATVASLISIICCNDKETKTLYQIKSTFAGFTATKGYATD